MKRLFLGVLFFFLFGFFFHVVADNKTGSVDRFAVCDLCGYCQGGAPPSTWEKCRDCLYNLPGVPAQSGQTLRIDPETNTPPTPLPGHMYTMLGCINTNLGGFRQEGAAAGVIQTLLNIIFSIAGGLAFFSLLYGSFIIITSQNDPEKLNYGKRVIYGAIIGVIFSLSSVFLINFLASGVLKIPGFGSAP